MSAATAPTPTRNVPRATRLRAPRGGSWRVRVVAEAAAPSPPTPATPSSSSTALTLRDVGQRLHVQPALIASLVGFVAALALHGLFGAATHQLRAHTAKAAARTAEVAVADAPLAEDLAPPPPPPPPPPAPPATSSAPPAETSSTATPLPSLVPAPGVAPAGSGGPSMSVAAGPAQSSTSLAQALPQTAASAQAATPTLVPARPLSRPPPRYPDDARRRGVTGRVVLQIHVDDAGRVDDVRVVESDPAGVFDAAALDCARAFTFAPATRDGAPVASWVRQTLRFALDGDGGRP